MNYQFYCRESKANKNGLAPVELSIVINGKRTIFQLDRKEFPSKFKTLISSKKNNDLKVYLDLMRNKINKGINDLMLNNKEITTNTIKSYIINDGIKAYTIKELVNDFLKLQMEKVKAGECTEGVYKKYEIITNRFIDEIKPSTDCNVITPAQIDLFYLKMRKIYVDATLSGQMFRLKSVFNYGVENGYLRTNPFKVKIQRAKAKMEFLTEEEMTKIMNTDYKNESLNKIRDLAVFQCGSGLSYADLSKVAPDALKVSDRGVYYIIDERCKTGVEFTSVLLPFAVDVWNKYSGVLPTISNQKYNAYLKTIQDLAGIEKNLHTHIFRKTYATYLLNSGVRMDVVAKAVGHTSTRITAATYAFMQKNTVIDEIGKIL